MKKILFENVKDAKKFRLDKLIGALEDQDKLLEGLIDNMPKSEEKQDLLDVQIMLIEVMAKIEGRY